MDVFPNRRLRILPKLLGEGFYPEAEDQLVEEQEAKVKEKASAKAKQDAAGDGSQPGGQDSQSEPKKAPDEKLYINYNASEYKKPPIRITTNMSSFHWELDTENCDHKGKVTFFHTKEVRDHLKMYSEIRVYVHWVDVDGKVVAGATPPAPKDVDNAKASKPAFRGFINNIIYTPKEIECDLVAYGVLLKQSPEGSFTDKERSYIIRKLAEACGLNADVSIPKDCDDKTSFSLTTASAAPTDPTAAGAAGTSGAAGPAGTNPNINQTNNAAQIQGQYVTAVGKPSCGYCTSYKYTTYKSTFVNYCPICGANNTLYFNTGKRGKQDSPEGQLSCSKCDADLCIVCGSEKIKPKRGTLTRVSGPVETNEPLGVSGAPAAGGMQPTDGSQTPQTAWEAIQSLCKDSGCLIYPIMRGDTVYVHAVPDNPTADYTFKWGRDFIEDSLKVDERNPLVSDTVMVVYGDKTNPEVYILDGAGAKSASTLLKSKADDSEGLTRDAKAKVSKTINNPANLMNLTAPSNMDGVDTVADFRLINDLQRPITNGTTDRYKLKDADKPESVIKSEVNQALSGKKKGGVYSDTHVYIKSGKVYTYSLHTGSDFERKNAYVVVASEVKDKKEAKKKAVQELWRMLSESGWESTFEVVYNPEMQPGVWVDVDFGYVYPPGRYYMETVSINGGADTAPKATITLLDIQKLSESKDDGGTTPAGNIDSIGQQAARFGYERHRCSNAQCLVQRGKGDCWALSEWLYQQLTAAGIRARVVEYPTGASPVHRTVQIYQNGAWVDFPYAKYGIDPMFHPTAGAANGKVLMGG